MRLLSLALFLLLSSPKTFAVEAHYNLGLELKPLPIILTSMSGGQGLGVAVEMSSSAYQNWSFIIAAEAFRGPRQDEGMVPENIEQNSIGVEETDYEYQQISFGLRSYSNKQDDTYYVGGELAIASENQQFLVGDSTYNVQSQNLRPAIEFGYRWVWDNGSMFRLGMKGIVITGTRNRLNEKGEELPEEWRAEFLESLEEAEKDTDIYATMDIGVGYSF